MVGVLRGMISNFSRVAWGRRVFVALCLGLSAAALSGCISTEAGAKASAVAYVRGELGANLNREFDQVVDATRTALADMEFARLSENRDADKAVLVSRTAMDKRVEVTLEKSGKRLTNIKIRVGVFGDEQVSKAVLDKIRTRL